MQLKQVEMIVRVNVSVPLNASTENLFVDLSADKGMQVCNRDGSIVVNSKVNEYETIDVVPC